MIRKLDELTFKLIDYEEKKKFKKKIKKYCKKYQIDKEDLLKYIILSNEVFNSVNKTSFFGREIANLDLGIARGQIINRLYELNKEFLSAIKRDYFNTANALIRQIIELFLIAFQISLDKDYSYVLTGNYQKHKGFPPFNQIIDKLSNNKERIRIDYSHYSGNFHPKEDSFMKNIFLLPPNFMGNVMIPYNTKLNDDELKKLKRYNPGFAKPYYENKKLMEQGWQLATLTKNSAGPNSKKIIEDFMFYAELILKLDKLA